LQFLATQPRTKKYLRKSILANKASGKFVPRTEAKPEKTRAVHQKSALRIARMEAAKQEAADTEISGMLR
jgi:hypothetical protein